MFTCNPVTRGTGTEMPLLHSPEVEAEPRPGTDEDKCLCFSVDELVRASGITPIAWDPEGLECVDEAGEKQPFLVPGFCFYCRVGVLRHVSTAIANLRRRFQPGRLVEVFVQPHGGGHTENQWCVTVLVQPGELVDVGVLTDCFRLGEIVSGVDSLLAVFPSGMDAHSITEWLDGLCGAEAYM